ncbi:MAG: ATP-binding protein [Phycisphaerales bacterium JB040]
MTGKVVEIRPGVNILGVLQHLEYKPWYALAEYVDNSIQSFLESRSKLNGQNHVEVDIEIDRESSSIVIVDNAGGISLEDFPRAFRPAEAPSNASGLSEFGMGMKSASCWFAPEWSVRTSAIGDPVERFVKFNMPDILESRNETVEIFEQDTDSESHFTQIILRAVHQIPQNRTLGKIRDHLSDIYRCFLRDGTLSLRVASVQLEHYEPDVLTAPKFSSRNEPEGGPLDWRKDIAFELSDGRLVFGQAGILAEGDTRRAGLSLYRRNRAIVGSGDEKYRPPEIFKSGNSYESQRVWGELHMDDFAVSHTKDGFQWRDSEDEFLEALHQALDSDDLPLLRQARNYRSGRPTRAASRAMKAAVENVAKTIENNAPDDLNTLATSEPVDDLIPSSLDDASEPELESRSFSIETAGETWTVDIELASDTASANWLEIATDQDAAQRTRCLQLRIHADSPFMRRIVKLDDLESLEPVIRLAAAIGLAEVLARMSQMDRHAGEMRRTINALLGSSLSVRDSRSR